MSQTEWSDPCRLGLEMQAEARSAWTVPSDEVGKVRCALCFRTFRRETDWKQHNCLDEWGKPMHEQRG